MINMKQLIVMILSAVLLIGCSKEKKKEVSQTEVSKPNSPKMDLFTAVTEGNLEAVQDHIAAGTDLNQRAPDDAGKSTPLMIAATFGHTEIASALIDAKADLNLVNAQQGDTALLVAAFLCHTEVVQALLKAGADKSIRNKTGASAYDTVAGSFEEVKGIYELLDGVLFKPLGKPLDYNRIQETRPKIALMLQ